MLKPENFYGNIEYKRYFKNINTKRFYELTTQMNFRLNEGNDICYYNIGVNDDGTIYGKLKNKEVSYSIKLLNKMAKECNAIITDVKSINNYFNITIKRKYMTNKLNEYNILFIGDTNTFKTTTIARIVKGKEDKNYIVNHKHEIESGLTSSMNYYSIEENNNKFLIFDSPGNDKYNKTLLKMVHSIDYDLVIFFSNNEWKYYNYYSDYFFQNNVKYIHNSTNMNKDDFLRIVSNNINFKEKQIFQDKDNVHFNVCNTFYNNELGLLLSGYLKYGKIKVNTEYYYNNKNLENNKIKVKIISIHGSNNYENNNISLDYIDKPSICTICVISNDIDFDKKLKYGYVSNI